MKPLTPKDIARVYKIILSYTPDNREKARQGLEAYLAGYNKLMPHRKSNLTSNNTEV
jgi:hypothetical protein